MPDDGKSYKTLWGSEVSADKVIGFCRLHRVHLTARQAEVKQCAGKCCRYFKKWDCPYWQEKERRKELRRTKKEAGIPPWQKVETRMDNNGNLVPTMQTKKLKK